jgi:hypothetical protein
MAKSVREQDEGDPLNKFIAVNRDKFTLKLYKRPEDSWEFFLLDQYEVAVGAKGYETPTIQESSTLIGKYQILSGQLIWD